MTAVLISVAVAVLLFELFEHLILPLLFYNKARKQSPLVGRRALQGKTARVVSWQGQKGTVLLEGEYWKASSDRTLNKNQSVRVTAVEHLVLVVEELPSEG